MPPGRPNGPIGTDFLPATDSQAGGDLSSFQARYSLADPVGLQGAQGATPLQQGGAKKGAATPTRELNIVGGAFNWDPAITDAQELAKLASNLWSPGTKDFVAVVNGVNANAITADSFGEFLGAIVTSPPGSIRRINLLTHANPDIIAFSGKMISTATIAPDVQMDVNAGGNTLVSLDTVSIRSIGAPGVFFQLPNNPTKFTITDIRGRFASDALIVLLACHSGLLSTFLQDIANFFQVTVVGFTSVIAFCPPPQPNPNRFNRTNMRVGIGSCSNKVADFRTLSTDPNAVKKVPQP
ncbi:MAG TPA: hypothetical protein VE860_23880 [Chthoniobacterales bacterium]|nr:hypothetical protein [Chthoniobacterales bacterium]